MVVMRAAVIQCTAGGPRNSRAPGRRAAAQCSLWEGLQARALAPISSEAVDAGVIGKSVSLRRYASVRRTDGRAVYGAR